MTRSDLVTPLLCLGLLTVAAAPAADFAEDFENATLRVDFYQYGDKQEQHMAVNRLIRQGTWAGPVRHLVDPLPYGIYVARLTDPADGRVLFEHGFDSYFGEYRTTGPAAEGVVRVFNESVLVPFPRRTTIFSLGERPPGGEERTLVELEIDPASVDIAQDEPAEGAIIVNGHVAGHPHHCLDIAFVGEGYTSSTAYDSFYPEGHEPAAPNITALLDPDNLKWADLASPGIELPIPWDKATYDEADLAYQKERRTLNAGIAEAARSGASAHEVKALEKAEIEHSMKRMAEVNAFVEATEQTELVGAFEGAGYVSKGLYRPQIDCIMFTRGVKPYCAVCRRAVDARIRVYTGEELPAAMVAGR